MHILQYEVFSLLFYQMNCGEITAPLIRFSGGGVPSKKTVYRWKCGPLPSLWWERIVERNMLCNVARG